MAELRILNGQEVRRALPMAEAIAGMKEAYLQLSSGRTEMPLRSRLEVPDQGATTLVMPAYLVEHGDLAVKIVGVFPNNADRGEPMIFASVVVLDSSSGRPLAILEGSSLTAIRTGAGSGAATDILAPRQVKTVAIFGSGVQARTQLEAVCAVREVTNVRVYSLHREHAHAFARDLAGRGPIPDNIEVVETPAAAIDQADIICTATTSSTAVFNGLDLTPGVHINAVGSYRPDMQEVDPVTINRSLVVVDSYKATLEEAGDLIIPLNDGSISRDHIHAELGEIIGGFKHGRTDDEQITYFKSVGVAVQDAVAGRIALENALTQDLGTIVDF